MENGTNPKARAKIKRLPNPNPNPNSNLSHPSINLLSHKGRLEISRDNIEEIIQQIKKPIVQGDARNIFSLINKLINRNLNLQLSRLYDIYYLMIENPNLDKTLVIKVFTVQNSQRTFLLSTLDSHSSGHGANIEIQVIENNQKNSFKGFDERKEKIMGFDKLLQAIDQFIEKGDIPNFYISNETFVQQHYKLIFRGGFIS